MTACDDLKSNYVFLSVHSCNAVSVLQPPEPETLEVSENEVNKTSEQPKHWISLGSEQEIDEESIKESRKKALQLIRNTQMK